MSASIRRHFGNTGISLSFSLRTPSVDIAAYIASSPSRRDRSWSQATHGFKEIIMKALISVLALVSLGVSAVTPALADGYKNCTKLEKASWKPAGEAEAKAKAAGYEVRRSKVEGSCYEVYGVKDGKLFELFYSPEDLSLKHTIAK
jgi:hypothetical protein